MVWPAVGSRTANEQNWTELINQPPGRELRSGRRRQRVELCHVEPTVVQSPQLAGMTAARPVVVAWLVAAVVGGGGGRRPDHRGRRTPGPPRHRALSRRARLRHADDESRQQRLVRIRRLNACSQRTN